MAKKKSAWKGWDSDMEKAVAILTPLGFTAELSPHQYEVAVVRGPDVQIMIYPHRTSAGHYHLRVRDHGSKNKARASWIMRALGSGYGLPEKEADRVRFCCTFSQKNQPISAPPKEPMP